jgi:hypothetical protein
MGWANCGQDSKGRYIGYAHSATCDHPECDAKIDRGLSYACGGMHGPYSMSGVECCEGYFCSAHRVMLKLEGEYVELCQACAKLYEDEDEEEEGLDTLEVT